MQKQKIKKLTSLSIGILLLFFIVNCHPSGDDGSAIEILGNNGFNYARIRLLVDPPGDHGLNQDLDYVISTAQEARSNGMKILLVFFYSDWWCNPGQNRKPDSWSDNIDSLEGHIYNYTRDVLISMNNEGVLPDMVQVGNEVNDGICWAPGSISQSGWSNFVRLTNAAYNAVRSVSPSIQVLMQYAGIGDQAVSWYQSYTGNGGHMDVIGISFYEMWHGTMNTAVSTLDSLRDLYGLDLYIVETAAYWKPSEGGNSTSYPHTKQGQYDFLFDLAGAIQNIPRVKGLFYWGAAWTQADKWLVAPDWNDDDAGCRGLFDNDAQANPAIKAINDAGGLQVIGADISEARYAATNGVSYSR